MKLTALLQDAAPHADGLIWVDHREEEESIVRYVADTLEDEVSLSCEWQDDCLVATYEGQAFDIPLTFSLHDRYVAISSLAEMLKADYEFWIERESLGSDTHGLLVASRGELALLTPAEQATLEARFQPLELGFDHFNELQVPYVGHLDNNPELAKQSAAQTAATDALVGQVLDSREMRGALQTMKAKLARLFGSGR